MSTTETAPETLVFTITDCAAVEKRPMPKPGLRLWEKAVVTLGASAVPTPLAATILNGHAGWTPLLAIAGASAFVATIIGHAHHENTWTQPKPTRDEFAWTGSTEVDN